MPTRVDLDPASLAKLAGVYRADRYHLSLTVLVEGARIYVHEDGVPPVELFPQSATFFLAPGDVAPYEFVVDANGRVRQLVSRGLDPLVLERRN